jgi:hypothetical protein
MPLLLKGLRKNTSLFRIHVAGCASTLVPPAIHEMARCAGGWIQEIYHLGYRNRFLSLISGPKESCPPRGVWPHTLARGQRHFLMPFLRCSLPNPAWCLSKGRKIREVRKRRKITASRRNGSVVTSESVAASRRDAHVPTTSPCLCSDTLSLDSLLQISALYSIEDRVD